MSAYFFVGSFCVVTFSIFFSSRLYVELLVSGQNELSDLILSTVNLEHQFLILNITAIRGSLKDARQHLPGPRILILLG
jgi:hypothetical protein